jgi:hypothetical protein
MPTISALCIHFNKNSYLYHYNGPGMKAAAFWSEGLNVQTVQRQTFEQSYSRQTGAKNSK